MLDQDMRSAKEYSTINRYIAPYNPISVTVSHDYVLYCPTTHHCIKPIFPGSEAKVLGFERDSAYCIISPNSKYYLTKDINQVDKFWVELEKDAIIAHL